jgi:hypothetical protein
MRQVMTLSRATELLLHYLRAADLLAQGSFPDDQVQLRAGLAQDRLLAGLGCSVPRGIIAKRQVGGSERPRA